MRTLLLVLLIAVAPLLGPASVAQPGDLQPGQATVRLRGGRDMVVHIYKPEGRGPFPTVIYLHGRALNRSLRDNLESAVPPGHAQWWLRQGVAVIAPVRPGYGATGGPDVEDTGARWAEGECVGEPDFLRVAQAAREPALAAYEWAQWQPWVQRDRMLVEGHSLGGLAAVAVAAANPVGVRGIVNFSGGTAGNPVASPGQSCRPDLMAAAYATLGRSTRVPSVWIYAADDRYWGREAPRSWHAAFRQGGSDSELVVTADAGGDGHQLLVNGGALWQEPLASFARKVGFLAR
ncbi:MAG: dipeptidyl aminopeptidase [Burkholderiales bacterium]|nr:dipeptidyl aminopeptidase [Burkholderiales bacterium]